MKRVCCLLVLVAGVIFIDATKGQTSVTPAVPSDQTRTGPLPFSSSIGSGAESVDLPSGALQVKIPLFSVSARGVTSDFNITYNSNIFGDIRAYDAGGNPVFKLGMNTDGGWRTGGSSGGTSLSTLIVKCSDYTTSNHHQQTYKSYTFRSPDLGTHPIASQFGGGNCGGTFSDPGPDLDALGMWESASTKLADGTIAGATVGTHSGMFVNANGNAYSDQTDPLNRALFTSTQTTNPDGSPTVTYTYKDSNGTSQTVVVTWANIPVSTHYGTGGDITGGHANMVQSISFANGQSYVFHYDSTWGLLSEVDLPSGGVITYSYSNTYGGGNLDGFYQEGNRRYVSSRIETVNGNSAPWTISIPPYSEFVGATSTSTVTYPTNHQSVFTSANGVVSNVKIYSGTAGGTPLREYSMAYAADATPFNDNCYGTNNPNAGAPPEYPPVGLRLASVITKLENGLQKKIAFDYDSLSYTYASDHCPTGPVRYSYTTSRGNITEIRDYDWGSGVPGPLLRKTDKTYLHVSGPNAAQYLAANIVNKVISDQVSDASGTVFSNTQYTYDDYSAADGSGFTIRASVPGHDYTDVPDSNTIRGNVTQVRRYLNSTGTWLRTGYSYDNLGNVTAIQDPLQHTTSWAYSDNWSTTDSLCLPTSNSYAYPTQVTDALGHLTKISYYDCTGKIRSILDPNDIANSRSGTVSTFDSLGRELTRTTSDGGSTTNTYTSTVPNTVTTARKITSSLTETTVSELDGLGRPRKSTLTSDPEGATYTRTSYDNEGRVSQVWNPTRCDPDVASSCAGETTFGYSTHNYDVLNREIQLIPQDGSSAANNVTTTYTGNTTTVTDEIGVQTMTAMDGIDRLSQVKEVNNGWITNYIYDILGNLTCVEQQGGVTGTGCSSAVTNDATSPWRVRRFTYDTLSRLLAAKNPEAGTSTASCNGSTNPWSVCYAYNDDSILTSKTDARGITVSYNPSAHPIDALHRVTGKTYSNSEPSVTYSYDSGSNGILRRTGMSDASGSAGWSYDAVGRVATESHTIGSIGKSISTTYNLDGSVWKITYPSGAVIEYTPGSAGRALAVQDDTHAIQFAKAAAYAPQGALKSLLMGYTTSFPGVTVSNQYNKRLQPGVLSAASPAATLMSFSYDFHLGTGNNGNIYGITNNLDATRSQSFLYSTPNRLSQAKAGTSWGATFTYDAWGNLYQTGTVAGTAIQAMSVNQIPSVSNRFTLLGYGYDPAGNVVSDGLTIGCGSGGFSWNAEGQMSCAAGVNYSYDGDGTRVKKSSGTLYWGTGPLAESDASGNLTIEYVFFNGNRIARRDITGGAVYYYFSDQLGSARVVTNATGTVQNDSDFYPFGGERQIVTNIANQHYKFTSKERDAESGLDNFSARYYGSSMGRFMSGDSGVDQDVEDPQSWNLYAYVRNKPITNTDPDGHDCIVQSRIDDTHESITVSSGDCKGKGTGSGQSATYVPGTVTGISVNGGNSIDIGYNSYDGQSSGLTNSRGAPAFDHPGIDGPANAAIFGQIGNQGMGAIQWFGEQMAWNVVGGVAGHGIGLAVDALQASRAAGALAEVLTKAGSAVGNTGMKVASREVAEQAAKEWVGPGARQIVDRGTGKAIGEISADGTKVARYTSAETKGYINLENKATGGNLHVRW